MWCIKKHNHICVWLVTKHCTSTLFFLVINSFTFTSHGEFNLILLNLSVHVVLPNGGQSLSWNWAMIDWFLRAMTGTWKLPMLHGDPSPQKNPHTRRSRIPRTWGPLGNLPKLLGTPLGTWGLVGRSEQISGKFRTDFGDVLGRFQGFSAQISWIFWVDYGDITGIYLHSWQSWKLMIGH